MKARRDRGWTLVELMLFCSIVTMLGLSLSQTCLVVSRWRSTVDEVVKRETADDRLRTALARAVLVGRPVDVLSIGSAGQLVEGRCENAQVTWASPETLVFGSANEYVVFEKNRLGIVRRRVGFDGHVSRPEVLITGLERSVLEIVRGSDGRFAGVSWTLGFPGSPRAVESFLAARVEVPAGTTPRSPEPATRMKGAAK